MLARQLLSRCIRPASLNSSRNLVSLDIRDHKEKPEPWDYVNRGFHQWHFWDFPIKRFDESTKFIVVEGNIASGKSHVAKELAERFGFHHIKEPSMDDILINYYGEDQRSVYHLLPEKTRLFDVKMFYENPFHVNVATFQLMMYMMRHENYENAIAHLLNTGQGVVMEGTPHSDKIYVDAMYLKGCISKDFYDYYYRMRECSLPFVGDLKPHLVVYLDTDAETNLENIKKRGVDYEINSEIMDLEYLGEIRRSMKPILSKEHDRHSSLLIYDWNTPGSIDDMVEDIENTDVGDTFDVHNGDRFETWHAPWGNYDWNYIRLYHTNKTGGSSLKYPTLDVAELWIHPDDNKKYLQVMHEHCFGNYRTGYNTSKGDSYLNILLGRTKHKAWVEHAWANNYVDAQLHGWNW